MAEKYVVYVAAPPEPPSSDARLRLAELLGLDLPKLDALLRRLPGEVTKPVPEATAITVARRFREAGLDASVQRRATGSAGEGDPGDSSPPASTEAPASPIAESRSRSAAGSGSEPRPAVERASEDDDWGREFGRTEASNSNDEDSLFPASAFTPRQGAKAPSKPLVIALLVVLAIFAALWILL